MILFWQKQVNYSSCAGCRRRISNIPGVVKRIRHYFSTYKNMIGEDANVSIEEVYDREHAIKVAEASLADYQGEFGT